MTDVEKIAEALKAARNVCLQMKDYCENVLAGETPDDDTTRDRELLNQSDTFLNWYESNIKK